MANSIDVLPTGSATDEDTHSVKVSLMLPPENPDDERKTSLPLPKTSSNLLSPDMAAAKTTRTSAPRKVTITLPVENASVKRRSSSPLRLSPSKHLNRPSFIALTRRGGKRRRSPIPSPGSPDIPRFSISSAASSNYSSMVDDTENVDATDRFVRGRRTASILISVRPGQKFSHFSEITVDPIEASKDNLGTLGEIRHLKETCSVLEVKKFIRSNHWPPGHRIRAQLWQELCNNRNMDANRLLYDETVDRLSLLGDEFPDPLQFPDVVVAERDLKEDSKQVLQRMLNVIETIHPDYTYVAVLHPLCAIFLHYMSEEDAFACVQYLFSYNQKFLHETDIAAQASKRVLMILTRKHLKQTYRTLSKLLGSTGKTHDETEKQFLLVFLGWQSWILKDLPFFHLIRTIDCFLCEGHKVLYRVALAILRLWCKTDHKTLGKGRRMTPSEISAEISSFCATMPVTAEKLLEVAFGIRNLKSSTIQQIERSQILSERQRMESRLSRVFSKQSMKSLLSPFRVGAYCFDSEILSRWQGHMLHSWLPARYNGCDFERLFSINGDGASFSTLWRLIEDYVPTLLVIQTMKGEILGAFCSQEWKAWKKRNGTNGFFGTGESFIFRFRGDDKSEAICYHWVGTGRRNVAHCEQMFMAGSPTMLIVGGGDGEAIAFRDTLEQGSTSRCQTFGNEPLSTDCYFKVKNMEVFGDLSSDD